MKCAHPMCSRGIGLVSHRRGWFDRGLYCSKACRHNYAEPRKVTAPRIAGVDLVASLFALPRAHEASDPVPASARVKAR